MGDPELDAVVTENMNHNQMVGPNAVKSRLFSKGIKVQRWRVRESMFRVDPGGATARASMTNKRRPYAVAGPSYLTHWGTSMVTTS